MDRLKKNAVFGGFDLANKLQGIVGVAHNDGPKMRHIASIWGMYVCPGARGTGLSRLLVKAELQDAQEHCRSVRLSVVSTNQAAIHLYQSLGFVSWALDTEALYMGGKFYDEVLMRMECE